MPEKKYLIEIPGHEDQALWDAEKFERNKDQLFKDHSEAIVAEIDAYSEDDAQDTDSYLIHVDGFEDGAIWDAEKFARNKEQLLKDHPTAQIQRVRGYDYFYNQAMDTEAALKAKKEEYAAWQRERAQADVATPSTLDLGNSGVIPVGHGFRLTNDENAQDLASRGITLEAEIERLQEQYDNNPRVKAAREEQEREDAEYKEQYPQMLREQINKDYEDFLATVPLARPRTQANKLVSINEEIDVIRAFGDIFRGKEAIAQQTTYDAIAPLFIQAKILNDEADRIRNAPSVNDDTNGFMKYLKGMGNKFSSVEFWSRGMHEVDALAAGGNVAITKFQKLADEKGDNLTADDIDKTLNPAEKAFILALMDKISAQAERANEFASDDVKISSAYKWGEGTADMVGYMAEFLLSGSLTGGIGGKATKAVSKWLLKNGVSRMGKKAIKGLTGKAAAKAIATNAAKSAGKALTGILSKSAGAVAGGVARTPFTLGLSGNIAARRTSLDEEGRFHDMSESVVYGGTDTAIENFSEEMGGAIADMLGLPFKAIKGGWKAATRNVDFGKIGGAAARVGNWAERIGKSNAFTFLRNAGFHGPIEELGEEFVGAAVRELTIEPGAWGQMANKEAVIDMLVTFAPMTVLGIAGTAAEMNDITKQAKGKVENLLKLMNKYNFSEEQKAYISDFMRSTSAEKLTREMAGIWQTMRAESGLGQEFESSELGKAVLEAAFATARYQTLFGKKQAEEQQQRDAKRIELEDKYKGRFYGNDNMVRIHKLKDGRLVFQVTGFENGEAGAINAKDGSQITIQESDIAETKTKEGKVVKQSSSQSLDSYLSGEIMALNMSMEEARMQKDRNDQIAALSDSLPSEINMGTEGTPDVMPVKEKNSQGVTLVDKNGNEIQLSWEQVGQKLGKPIKVLTDAEITEIEEKEIALRREARRAQRAQTNAEVQENERDIARTQQEIEDMTPAPEEAYRNQETGEIDENAFWENDPEGWAEYNDRVMNDGGQDTIEQIDNGLVLLNQQMAQLNKMAIDSPNARKAVKAQKAQLQEKINRLTTLQQKYVQQAEQAIPEDQRRAELTLQMRERLAGWRKRLGLTDEQLVSFESIEDILNSPLLTEKGKMEVLQAIGRGKTEGWYNTASTRAFVFLPDINSAEELDKTVAHEVVAHYGLHTLMGEKAYNELMDKVWDMMSDAAKRTYYYYPGVVSEKDADKRRRMAAEEFVAHVGEQVSLGEVTAEQKSLWQRIVDWFRNLFKESNFSDVDIADIVRRNYQQLTEQAAKESVEEFKAEAQEQAEQNASAPEVIENGTNIYSTKTYREGGRDYLAMWLQSDDSLSEEERKYILDTMDFMYNAAEGLAEKYSAFGAWSEADVVRDAKGDPIMSVIKANGDYAMNLDFSLVCKKRRALNALLNKMIKDERFDGMVLREKEIARINQILQKHGFEVACALCFVDAKRYRVANVATQFTSMYNDLVKSLIPKGSGYEALWYNYMQEPNQSEEDARKNPETVISNLPDEALDWTRIDKILKRAEGKKQLNVEEKIAKLLKSGAEYRRLASASDFISDQGFELVTQNNPELLKLYNAKKGTGGPKASLGDVQYLNNIAKSQAFSAEKAYKVGGVRIQSFSDYMPHMFFDYMQMMAELAGKRLPAHAYTKKPAFARLFGMTGMKINLSLVPRVDMDGIAPGLDAEGNYTWAVEYVDEEGRTIATQTFPPEVAFEMQQDPRYSGNVGAIAVGISDEHILKMLGDPNIHFVIPYHKSSLNPDVAKMAKIDQYSDYTNYQTEKLDPSHPNAPKGKLTATQKKAEIAKRAFDFFGSLAQTNDPKQTAADYLSHCKEVGLIPKFPQFANNENYYKLLVDFNTYDFVTGEYAPQGAVTMTFPDNMLELIEEGLVEDQQLDDKLNAEISEVAEEVYEEMGTNMFKSTRKSPNTVLPGEESPFKGTVMSSDSVANIIKEIDSAIEKYQNSNNDTRGFVSNMARLLGLKPAGPSNYATFIAINGTIFTLRMSDHNATVSNFDNVGENYGISIVVSRKPNTGLINDGEAGVAEFFYSDKKINKAEGKPLAEIVKSIKQMFYSGQYKDTTGLAETESANLFKTRTDSQREKLFADAKERFGVTDNFKVAGYMLPDGSLLDFSEANDGGDPNQRSLDHRSIEDVIMEDGTEYDSRWMYLADFMNEGAIRLLPEYAGINLMKAPTKEQRQRLMDFIYKYNGEVILEIADERLNNAAYVEYDRRTSPARIFRDIDGYFNEGIVPQSNTMFKTANNNQAIFVSNAAKAVEGIKMEKATPEQWLKMIEKNGGLKAGEDKWMGLSDWLKASDKKTLTKQEVLDFVNEHMIQIEEQHYGINAEDDAERAHGEISERLQDKFDNYVDEYYQDHDWEDGETDNAREYAIERLREEMGDTFPYTIELEHGSVYLTFPYEEEDDLVKWAEKTGVKYTSGVSPINDTRLNYTTDGLENKHEIALTVPTIERWGQYDDVHFGDAGDGRAVAWIRFGETQKLLGTTEVEGKKKFNWAKVLVIDEIQSKRHQEGREKGYKSDFKNSKEAQRLKAEVDRVTARLMELVNDKRENEESELTELARLDIALDNATSIAEYDAILEEQEKIRTHRENREAEELAVRGERRELAYLLDKQIDRDAVSAIFAVPDAPFDKNWHELAMKRMLRYAAENGYDVIAWTKGDQQAERYNIGGVLEAIQHYESEKGRVVIVKPRNNESSRFVVNNEGLIIESRGPLSGDATTLSDVVGKELASKIMSGEGEDIEKRDGATYYPAKMIKGEGIRIGGEGMKGFYDRMLPAFMNKYGKKWGVKVEDIHLNLEGGLDMHSVPVTEEMKESVMEGQLMFKTSAANNKSPEFSLPNELFLDNSIMFKVSRNNRQTINNWLNKRPDLSEDVKEQVLDMLDNYNDATLQLATGKWFAQNAIKLPDDMEKCIQAVASAKKAKVDPLRYSAPMDIINEFGIIESKKKPINPDTVPTLSKVREVNGGYAVYDVEESEESRKNMREIINTHFGVGCSPWCLLQGDENGNLTPKSAEFWQKYNAYPKQVVFKDGKLLAFSANDVNEVRWWSRSDKPYAGFPVEGKIKGDELGRSGTMVVDTKRGKVLGYNDIHKVVTNGDTKYTSRWEDAKGPIHSFIKSVNNREVGGFYNYSTHGLPFLEKLFTRKGLLKIFSGEEYIEFDNEGKVDKETRGGYDFVYDDGVWTVYSGEEHGYAEYKFRKGNLISANIDGKDISDKAALSQVEVPNEVTERIAEGREPSAGVIRKMLNEIGYEGNLMFKTKQPQEFTRQFMTSALNDFYDQYNTFAPASVVYVKNRKMIEDALGFNAGEMPDWVYDKIKQEAKTSPAYLVTMVFEKDGKVAETKRRILIFANDDVDLSSIVDWMLFHENTHALLTRDDIDKKGALKLGEWLLECDNKHTRGIADWVRRNYEKESWSEEMLCECVGKMLAIGRGQWVLNLVPEEYKPILNEIYEKFGYNPEREDGRRYGEISRDIRELQMRNTKSEGSDSDKNLYKTAITPEVRREMDVISAQAIVNGNYLKAPNGKDSKLTPEQWAMVRTKNFKRWFGDWENDPANASKVVDPETGEPMVVYHGTAGVINKFEDQQRTPGFWFVNREDVANGYAESASAEFGEEKNIIPVFLNIRNPRVEDAHAEYDYERESGREYDPKRGGLVEKENILFKTTTARALRGLVTIESSGASFESVQQIVRSRINGLNQQIDRLNRLPDSPHVKSRLATIEEELEVAKLQESMLNETASKLIDETLVEPDYDSALSDMTPRTIDEAIAQALTMSVDSAKRKVGVMLKPESLAKELGWNKDDWKGMSYIVSDKGVSLDRFAEMLEENSELADIFSGMDTMEIKDAIIDFLMGMSTYSDIRDFTRNARMREAREEAEAINNEILSRSEETRGGLTVEEYNSWMIESDRKARRDELEVADAMTADISDIAEQIGDSTKDNTDAARATLMDKLRNINQKIASLRSIMAAQKEYDKATVKTITDIANDLLTSGALTNVTRGEVKKILSIINGGIGKKDMTVSANRLIDLMINNQLSFLGGLVDKFMKARTKKVNASGVEIRGEVDAATQKVMDAFRRGMKMEATELENAIIAEMDKMSSTSETIRDNAGYELSGLQFAKRYYDDVRASMAEESALMNEIKDTKEAQSLGLGFNSNEDYRAWEDAVRHSIRVNEIERIAALQKLVEDLSRVYTGGVENAKLLKEGEKARVEQIQHYANSDMQGLPDDEHSNVENWFVNNALTQTVTAALGTFEQWMRLFGSKSADGKGYLYNHFMGGWNDANNNEYLGIKEAHEILDAKVKEIFGSKVNRWSDLFSLDKVLSRNQGNSITFWDGGQMKEHKVTQGNLLYIYMVNKMTDGKMKLRKMGITEADVIAIKNSLDPRFIQLADWIQSDFLPSLRDKYNAVHERLFGAPMAAIEDYFPIKVNSRSRVQNVDLGIAETDAKPSTITGSIIKRTRNSLALDIMNANAFDVILDHIQQMEHWAAFAEFNKDLNSLMSYRKFRNRVENMTTVFGAGKKAWDNFRKTAEIVAGVYRPEVGPWDRLTTTTIRGLISGKINFRIWTAIKQILSLPGFLPYTSAASIAKGVATPWKSWNWAMNNLPSFQKRWLGRKAGNVRLHMTEADWETWKSNAMETISRIGMTPNAFVDAVTCSIGAKAVYDTQYAKYLKDGYTREQADKKAKLEATVAFNATQQSSESAFLSAVQMNRTFIAHILTVFRNNSFGMQRELTDALRNMTKRMKKGFRSESVEFMQKQMMRDGLAEEQAKRAAERIYRRSFYKDAARIATFGFLMQFLWNLGSNAIYLLFGDDDDEKKKMIVDAAIRGMFGSIEGLGFGNIVTDGVIMALNGEIEKFNPSYSPAMADIGKVWNDFKYDWVSGVNDLVNIAVQMGVGLNPQIITDTVLAVTDACDGDVEMSKEVMLAIMRILQVPQSQADLLKADEIDFTKDEGLEMTIAGFARKYAEYKRQRGAGAAGALYTDEHERDVEDRYIKRFMKQMEELRRSRGNEEAKKFYEYLDTEYTEVTKTMGELSREMRSAAQRGDRLGAEEFAHMLEDFMNSDIFKRYAKYGAKAGAVKKLRDQIVKVDSTSRSAIENAMLQVRKEMVEEMDANN